MFAVVTKDDFVCARRTAYLAFKKPLKSADGGLNPGRRFLDSLFRPGTETRKGSERLYFTYAQAKTGVNGLNHIHYFLKSCSPSLGHLLSRFINLGFKSVGTLRSGMQLDEERLELLKKLRVKGRDIRAGTDLLGKKVPEVLPGT